MKILQMLYLDYILRYIYNTCVLVTFLYLFLLVQLYVLSHWLCIRISLTHLKADSQGAEKCILYHTSRLISWTEPCSVRWSKCFSFHCTQTPPFLMHSTQNSQSDLLSSWYLPKFASKFKEKMKMLRLESFTISALQSFFQNFLL